MRAFYRVLWLFTCAGAVASAEGAMFAGTRSMRGIWLAVVVALTNVGFAIRLVAEDAR